MKEDGLFPKLKKQQNKMFNQGLLNTHWFRINAKTILEPEAKGKAPQSSTIDWKLSRFRDNQGIVKFTYNFNHVPPEDKRNQIKWHFKNMREAEGKGDEKKEQDKRRKVEHQLDVKFMRRFNVRDFVYTNSKLRPLQPLRRFSDRELCQWLAQQEFYSQVVLVPKRAAPATFNLKHDLKKDVKLWPQAKFTVGLNQSFDLKRLPLAVGQEEEDAQ